MSTFKGLHITQLICPKPATSSSEPSSSPGTTRPAHIDCAGGEQGSEAGEREGSSGVPGDTGFDTRERGEAFMCVSLEVKNMLGVEDALEKFTEKELIEGYAWDDEVLRC